MFNPSSASHHEGAWERCIRTVTKVLSAVVKQQTLTDEGLMTSFCEVEAIVNRRPITKSSDDPNDSEALTTNHLLLLIAGPRLPPGAFFQLNCYARKRWPQLPYLADLFWQRWIKEYLPQLQERHKWLNPSRRRHCTSSGREDTRMLLAPGT